MDSPTHILRRDKFLRRGRVAVDWLDSIRADPILLFLFFLTMLVSLTTIYSAATGDILMVVRQALYYGAAFCVLFVVTRLEIYIFRRLAFLLYICGLLFLILVLLVGEEINGARRWIYLGPVNFQPSEYVKIVTLLALCWILTYKPLPISLGQLAYVVSLTLVPIILIFMQPDLGTALILMMSSACLIFLAGIQFRSVLVTFSLFMVSLPFLWFYVLHEYHKKRILSFMDPAADPLGSGWSLIQSKIAIGTGGIWGKGWGNNQQAGLEFLPETHTDFIFSIFAEEHGLVGVTVLIILYLMIILRGFYITLRARDSFEKLFCGGFIFMFALYVIINIGMVSGILPIVGVPLPLVSYGGSALITTLGAFGILMSVHAHSRRVA